MPFVRLVPRLEPITRLLRISLTAELSVSKCGLKESLEDLSPQLAAGISLGLCKNGEN